MPQVKIGLVQMQCEKGAIAQNIAQIREYVGQAIEQQADFLCLPEMSLTGYINPNLQPEACLHMFSDPVNEVADLTAGTKLVLLFGIVEENTFPGGNRKPYITQIVAANGKYMGKYRKFTVIDEEAEWFSPSSSIRVNLTHPHLGLKFGIAICADIETPQIFEILAKSGAPLILECAAPGLYGAQATRDWQAGFDWWKEECQTKLGRYARDNQVYIAVSTQAGRTIDEDFPGGGYVFAPSGECIAATPDWSPGVLWATLDL